MTNRRTTSLPPASAQRQIGRRLAAVRQALGLRPVDICETLGFSQALYSQWESGKSRPNISDMIRFCEWYDIPLDYIYRGRPGGLPHSIANDVIRFAAE